MSCITQATKRAKKWLENIKSTNEEVMALRDLGFIFCEAIFTDDSTLHLLRKSGKSFNYQEGFPLSLITMERKEILSLASEMSLTEYLCKVEKNWEWGQIIGGISLSYARYGDIPVVAALVRIAALHQLNSPLLDDAHSYLIDQQEPDGSFGIFARELKLINSRQTDSDEHIKLRLTVEVLWSFAEICKIQSKTDYDDVSSMG